MEISYKPLLEIFLFGSKKIINYQIKFALNLFSSYQSLFYSWMKQWFGKMSFRGTVRSGNCPSGNCSSEKCLRGTVRREKFRRENVHRELSDYSSIPYPLEKINFGKWTLSCRPLTRQQKFFSFFHLVKIIQDRYMAEP